MFARRPPKVGLLFLKETQCEKGGDIDIKSILEKEGVDEAARAEALEKEEHEEEEEAQRKETSKRKRALKFTLKALGNQFDILDHQQDAGKWESTTPEVEYKELVKRAAAESPILLLPRQAYAAMCRVLPAQDVISLSSTCTLIRSVLAEKALWEQITEPSKEWAIKAHTYKYALPRIPIDALRDQSGPTLRLLDHFKDAGVLIVQLDESSAKIVKEFRGAVSRTGRNIIKHLQEHEMDRTARVFESQLCRKNFPWPNASKANREAAQQYWSLMNNIVASILRHLSKELKLSGRRLESQLRKHATTERTALKGKGKGQSSLHACFPAPRVYYPPTEDNIYMTDEDRKEELERQERLEKFVSHQFTFVDPGIFTVTSFGTNSENGDLLLSKSNPETQEEEGAISLGHFVESSEVSVLPGLMIASLVATHGIFMNASKTTYTHKKYTSKRDHDYNEVFKDTVLNFSARAEIETVKSLVGNKKAKRFVEYIESADAEGDLKLLAQHVKRAQQERKKAQSKHKKKKVLGAIHGASNFPILVGKYGIVKVHDSF